MPSLQVRELPEHIYLTQGDEAVNRYSLRYSLRLLFYLFLLSLSLSGCMLSSISESSDSISDSSTSISKSSRSSSAESQESYLRDIKQYTAIYINSSSNINELTKGVATISEKHGVTDWEAYSATFLGIGEGFAKAALSQQQVDEYAAFLALGDLVKMAMIQQGFSSGL